MIYSEPQKPDPDYLPIQLELDIQAEPQPTQLEIQPHSRHSRLWWQDPLIRTWLFPPAVGAGLGVVFSLGQFIVRFVLSLFVLSADVPNLLNLPFDFCEYGFWGLQAGLVVSALIQFWKLPHDQRSKILKAVWRGVCVLTLLFAVLMSFGLLGGLLGSQLNRRL